MHCDLITTLAEAAALAELDECDLAWSCAEFGHCDSDNYIIFPADDGEHFIVRRR